MPLFWYALVIVPETKLFSDSVKGSAKDIIY